MSLMDATECINSSELRNVGHCPSVTVVGVNEEVFSDDHGACEEQVVSGHLSPGRRTAQRLESGNADLSPRHKTSSNNDRNATQLRPMGWPSREGHQCDAHGDGDIDDCGEDFSGGLGGFCMGTRGDGEQRILLNVGGVRHETRLSTLRAIPNTRLSRLAQTHCQLMDIGTPSSLSPASPLETSLPTTEYFFDRHPAVFNAVIDFYRTGELHVPLEVCGAVVKRELDFWEIDEMEIKACCWRHYRSYIENQAILDSFNQSLLRESHEVNLEKLQGWNKWQMRIWLILDHPRTSKAAMAYGIISFLFVATSIAGFCLETLPGLRPGVEYNVTANCKGTSQVIHRVISSNPALNVVDIICTVFFTLELILRFIFAPNKFKFVISPMNIIDLLALVPLYVQVIFQTFDLQACYMNEQFVIEIMFILRIFRMFRIFHLVKHYQALKVLVYSLRASLQELLMLFIFLLIAMLVFATMIYYAERKDAINPSERFNTIPVGFWWAIITMTTVGYGDVFPVTPIGYVVGTACGVAGVLLLALTFPVISNNFTLFYQHVRSRPIQRLQAHNRKLAERAGEGEAGGVAHDGGRGGRAEEEELLLYSPASSPSHSGQLKLSVVSGTVEPYMNGGTLARSGSTMCGPRPSGNSYVKQPPLAKFSDSNSMTDIVLQPPPCKVDFSGPESHQPKSPYAGSPRRRKTHSDDGVRYQGETRL